VSPPGARGRPSLTPAAPASTLGAVNASRRLALAALFAAATAAAAFAQTGLRSAVQYFDDLRKSYDKITSYEATVTIKQDTTTSSGRLSYKAPNLLNVRFDSGMVMNMDGKRLDVTMPGQKVWLEQAYKNQAEDQGAGIATATALSAMKARYSVAYLTGPDAVALDKDIPEKVVKLRLVARTATSFSQLILSVGTNASKDLYIRRVEGTLTNGSQMQVDFTGIKLNVSFPASRFVFVAPDGYEQVKNWLFDPAGTTQQ
jgi:outer membrane lipoprotein-sorting protein